MQRIAYLEATRLGVLQITQFALIKVCTIGVEKLVTYVHIEFAKLPQQVIDLANKTTFFLVNIFCVVMAVRNQMTEVMPLANVFYALTRDVHGNQFCPHCHPVESVPFPLTLSPPTLFRHTTPVTAM